MSWWRGYWVDDGGRLALAVVRVAVALAVLLSLRELSSQPALAAPASIYRAVGVWRLWGSAPPPALLVDVLLVFAWVGTFAMLVGLASRTATVISVLSSLAVISLAHSDTASWSHSYNVVCLAQIAMLGSRCGDTFSADAWIRRRRGLPAHDVPGAYQWSLRLVQAAVALMFVNACYYKLRGSGFTLRWALSDNLRHQLLARYDLAGLDRTWLANWVIDDVWRYRAAALLNLISQAAPLAAVIFVRRPLVRAVVAALFVAEGIAIDWLLRLPNTQWLPLAAVFIDWDSAAGWLGRRLGHPPKPPPPLGDARLPLAASGFVGAFLVYYVVVAFVPRLDQRLNTYPFSGFPVFSSLRASPPYDTHQPYSVAADYFELLGRRPIPRDLQWWVDHDNRGLFRATDPDTIAARLATVLATTRAQHPELDVHVLRHYVALFEAPAYPAKARFERHPIAITAETSADGTIRTLLGKLDGTDLVLVPRGVDTSGARLVYYADDRVDARELPATRNGNVFRLAARPAGKRYYIVAIIADTPWLVASKAR